MADDSLFPLAVAVRDLSDVNLIDSGLMVDVRFIAADGRKIAVIIPRKVFEKLRSKELAPPTPLRDLSSVYSA